MSVNLCKNKMYLWINLESENILDISIFYNKKTRRPWDLPTFQKSLVSQKQKKTFLNWFYQVDLEKVIQELEVLLYPLYFVRYP